MNKIEHQEKYYDHVGNGFDVSNKRLNANHFYKIEMICRRFRENIFADPGRQHINILEVGAGTGLHAEIFAKQFHSQIEKFYVSDLSQGMLDVAINRLQPYANIIVPLKSSAEELNLNERFDGVYVSGSLHHFSDPNKAINNIHRLLKPDGLLVLCEPNVWNPINFLKAIKSWKEEEGQFSTARRNRVVKTLLANNFAILSNEVLHFKSGNLNLRKIIRYESFKQKPYLDLFSIMYLIAAKSTSYDVRLE